MIQLPALSTAHALQIFQALRLGALILSSVLLAKTGLRTTDIGQYEALLYLGASVSFFWVVGLLQAIAPEYARLLRDTPEAPERPRQLLFNVFLVFYALSAGVFVLLYMGKSVVLPALTGLSDIPHYHWFCLYLLFNLPTIPVEHFYLVHDKPWPIVIWGLVSAGCQLLCFFVPIYAGWGMEGAFMGLFVLALLKFGWTLGVVRGFTLPIPDLSLIRPYLHFALPLMANTLVGNLILLFDNWLVGWYYRDEAVFAIFRYGSREFPLATALATALGMAMVPRLSAAPEAGMAELKTRSRRLMHGLFPLSIALLFLSKPLFPWVFNPDFAASAPLFNIYLLLTASRVLLPNALLLARGESRILLWVGLAELMLKISLGYWFIQVWGLPGLAFSVVICFWFEKVALILYLEQKLGMRTDDWLDLKWYGWYTALLLGSWAAAEAF